MEIKSWHLSINAHYAGFAVREPSHQTRIGRMNAFYGRVLTLIASVTTTRKKRVDWQHQISIERSQPRNNCAVLRGTEEMIQRARELLGESGFISEIKGEKK